MSVTARVFFGSNRQIQFLSDVTIQWPDMIDEVEIYITVVYFSGHSANKSFDKSTWYNKINNFAVSAINKRRFTTKYEITTIFITKPEQNIVIVTSTYNKK